MSQLGEFLGGLYQQHEVMQEKLRQEAKKTSLMRRYAPEAGIMSKEEAEKMSGDQLEGAIAGHHYRQESEKNAAQLTAIKNKMEEDNAMSAFAEKLLPMLGQTNALPALADSGQTGNPSLDAILQFAQEGQKPQGIAGLDPRVATALAGMGRTDPHMASTVMRGLLPQLMSGGDQPGSYEVPETGAMFTHFRGTYLPAGYKPPDAASIGSRTLPQHDEEGQLIGWTMTDQRGHSTFRPNKTGPMRPAMTADGAPIPGYYMTADGRPVDTRTAFQKQGFEIGPDGKLVISAGPPKAGGAGGAAGSRGNPLPYPKSASEAKKDTYYHTRYGPGKWDGKQMVYE